MASTSVFVTSGAALIPAELHTPAGTATAGLVVVAHGTDGFEDNERGQWQTMIRGYAEALAKLGLFALIPEYFVKTGTEPGAAAMEVMLQHRSAWAAALADCATYARTLARVDPARIGLLGFSLGGHLVVYARSTAKPRALVEYFAPMLDGIGPAHQVPHAQIHHGTNDQTPGTGFANAGEIERLLRAEGTAVTLFSYPGAGHGFAGHDPANRKANAASKERTLEFFARHL